MTSTDSNSSLKTGVTPQLRFSFLQTFSDVVIPMIFIGGLKRLTIRAVIPEMELMTMPFAFVSIAMAQVAWDTASILLLISYSVEEKRFL